MNGSHAAARIDLQKPGVRLRHAGHGSVGERKSIPAGRTSAAYAPVDAHAAAIAPPAFIPLHVLAAAGDVVVEVIPVLKPRIVKTASRVDSGAGVKTHSQPAGCRVYAAVIRQRNILDFLIHLSVLVRGKSHIDRRRRARIRIRPQGCLKGGHKHGELRGAYLSYLANLVIQGEAAGIGSAPGKIAAGEHHPLVYGEIVRSGYDDCVKLLPSHGSRSADVREGCRVADGSRTGKVGAVIGFDGESGHRVRGSLWNAASLPYNLYRSCSSIRICLLPLDLAAVVDIDCGGYDVGFVPGKLDYAAVGSVAAVPAGVEGRQNRRRVVRRSVADGPELR